MRRLIPFVLCLMLVIGFTAATASAEETGSFYVHFVVVPAVMPDGADASPMIMEFKKEVIAMAGGYTELGPSKGGAVEDGVLVQQENVSFVIGAKKDISKELKALSEKLFKGKGAFILAWPGKVLF